MTDASPPTCEWLTKIDHQLRLLLGNTTFLPFSVLNLLFTNNGQGHCYNVEQTTKKVLFMSNYSEARTSKTTQISKCSWSGAADM